MEIATRKQLLSHLGHPLVLALILLTLQHTSTDLLPRGALRLATRSEEAQCSVDLGAADACQLVQKLCPDFDDDGLIPYLRMYACSPAWARPVVVSAMVLWLGVLFASMAVAAAEFLSVHLEVIVQTVGISENLAGVTIFAFGNGCSDLFSTVAAMGANSGSLAISELFGAASFITTVVLGLIILIMPFSVDPRTFVGDTVWFIVAASSLLAFLADGQLVMGECLGIIGLYAAFVLFATYRPESRLEVEPSGSVPGRFEDHAESDASIDETATRSGGVREASGPEDDSTPIAGMSERSGLETLSLVDLRDDSESHAEADGQSESDYEADDPLLTAQEAEDVDSRSDTESHMARLGPSSPSAASPLPSFWSHFPTIHSWNAQSTGQKILTVFSLPLLLPIGITTPSRIDTSSGGVATAGLSPNPRIGLMQRLKHVLPWDWPLAHFAARLQEWKAPDLKTVLLHWVICLQLVLGPQSLSLVVVTQSVASDKTTFLALGSLTALLASTMAIVYVFSNGENDETIPRGRLLISIEAFAVSIVWIYLTATSAVSLLMTLAFILKIPTALLGATVFAVGQSSNDLVANTAVAKRGMPVLAASATFGGPMMNMLIGIGGGGLIQVLKAQASGGQGVYTFHTAPGLFVSAACLLLGLSVTLAFAILNSWRLERRLGVILITIWVLFIVANVTSSILIKA